MGLQLLSMTSSRQMTLTLKLGVQLAPSDVGSRFDGNRQ